jgi:hypothetical protein
MASVSVPVVNLMPVSYGVVKSTKDRKQCSSRGSRRMYKISQQKPRDRDVPVTSDIVALSLYVC